MTGNETLKELFGNHTSDELLQMYNEWHYQKETGLSKTPENILKGLKSCIADGRRCNCKECPYDTSDCFESCTENVLRDAYNLIKQLYEKLEEKLEEKHD